MQRFRISLIGGSTRPAQTYLLPRLVALLTYNDFSTETYEV